MKWILLGLLFTVGAWGQAKFLNDFDPDRDLIAEDYSAGAFLISDCQAMHWVCVIASDFEECQKNWSQQGEAIAPLNKCFPVREFPNKKSCFQEQLFLASQNYGARYCRKMPWRQKDIGI